MLTAYTKAVSINTPIHASFYKLKIIFTTAKHCIFLFPMPPLCTTGVRRVNIHGGKQTPLKRWFCLTVSGKRLQFRHLEKVNFAWIDINCREFQAFIQVKCLQ